MPAFDPQRRSVIAPARRAIDSFAFLVVSAALLSALVSVDAARAACTPVTPVACEECFAVFVMPDTQYYTMYNRQPYGAAHLDLMTRYICDNAASWTEPSTGKQMPIVMVAHLGDMVQAGDLDESGGGPLAQWVRVSDAYDRLDACGVPYIVTTGNHDYADRDEYQAETVGYETYFGVDRWIDQGYGCDDPQNCSGLPGDWFVGGGDPIAANSRNNVGEGTPGPPTEQAGRHRAAVIRAPNGQRFLFLGLELAFDFPPAAPGFEGVEGDDAAWVKQLLNDYADLPTLVFHHSLILTAEEAPTYQFGTEDFEADSIPPGPAPFGPGIGMRAVWNELLEPRPQVFTIFSGHVIDPDLQADVPLKRPGAATVRGFRRNYQTVELAGAPHTFYGVGWNVIAAVDPEAGQLRVRSYRIDDTDNYAEPPIDYDHDGTPAATECLDTDYDGFGESIVPFQYGLIVEVDTLPMGRPLLIGLVMMTTLLGLMWVVARRA